MKKLIFAATAALVIAAFVSSCKTEDSKCYFVQYTIPAQEEQTDSTGEVVREAKDEFYFEGYKWMSSSEATSCQNAWKSLGYTDISVKENSDYKTKAACLQATYAD